MENNTEKIARIQSALQALDLEGCKFIASWLSDHIKQHGSFNKTIHDLKLSNRAFNVLRKNGIVTLQQLLNKTAGSENIWALKGAGKIVTQELQQKIAELRNGNKLATNK